MDFHIALALNHFWQWTWVDLFSKFISWTWTLASVWIIMTILAVLLKKKYRKKIILSFVLAVGLAYLVSNLGFKTLLVHETGMKIRPYVAHATDITPIGKRYTDSSFPSTHMVITIAMITVLIILFPTMRPYAILYALIMARSRIHNGMHYPSDVLAWSLLGLGCWLLAIFVSKNVLNKNETI